MVSQYYYQKQFDNKSKNQTFSEYIRTTNDFDQTTYQGDKNRVAYWAFHVNSWIEWPNCLLLSFEDIRNDIEAALNKVSHFIDEPLNPAVRDVAIRAKAPFYTFSKLFRKVFRIGIDRSAVKFRKGRIGDWKEHFSQDDLTFFDEESEELNHRLGFG
jgi:hypothetical protein